MGDFNLSHRIHEDQDKIKSLCQNTKESILHEITRSISLNQLDYILVENTLKEASFATSFNNFISDHKAIAVRIGLDGNTFTEEFKVKLTFDDESHCKPKFNQRDDNMESSISSGNEMSGSSNDELSDSIKEISSDDESPASNNSIPAMALFKRRFKNVDMATCWLNSCLQLVLSAIDNFRDLTILTSELGQELLQLKNDEEGRPLDPTNVKEVLASTEDTRITLRISEIEADISDQIERAYQIELVQNSRFDMYRGQQCVRDFFTCLQVNLISWPDVCSNFNFKTTHSTECLNCHAVNRSETTQLHVGLPVPSNNEDLNNHVEEYFNINELVGVRCENCKKLVQKEKGLKLTSVDEAEFLIVILQRTIETLDGYELVKDRTVATNDVYIR